MPPVPSGHISLTPLSSEKLPVSSSQPLLPVSGLFHMMPPSPVESTEPSEFITMPPVHIRLSLIEPTGVPSNFTAWQPPWMTSLYQTTSRT